MRRSAAFLALSLALAACAHAEGSREAPAPPTAPPRLAHAPGDHPFDFTADQTVEAEVRGRALAMRVVMEKRGDRLALVGLTPFGARAYSVVQEGARVRAEVAIEGDLSFPPEVVVADVHRTFLVGFPAPPGTGDGSRAFAAGGDAFEDRVEGGRVRARRVTPGDPADEPLAIRYEPEGMALDGTPPGRVVVRHERTGLVLTITTTSFRRAP